MGVAALPDLNKVKRVLIIRLSSIGDVTHALPIAAALGDAFPHLEITWVVEEMSAAIVEGHPYLREVIVLPRSRWKKGRTHSPQVWREYLRFLAGLRARRFDVTIDLQGYAKSGLMALATGAAYRIGWWRLRDGSGLISKAIARRPESVHRVEWFLDVARELGANPDRVKFALHVPAEARARVGELLCAHGLTSETPYAVLNPAVGSETRRWGAPRYAELVLGLASRLKLPTVLIGSGKDREINQEVVRLATEAGEWPSAVPLPLDLAGQTSLKELAAVLERCAVHVCGDTGSAHIAAALERPVIALYGPTDPAHAGPWNQSANVLSRRELCHADCNVRKCARVAPTPDPSPKNRGGEPSGFAPSPCSWGEGRDGGRTAPCLVAITPEEVLARVERTLHECRGR